MTLRSLKVYRVEVDIEDDPASLSYTVLLTAWGGHEARSFARAAALGAYYEGNPGWARKPKATVGPARRVLMPENTSILAVSLTS